LLLDAVQQLLFSLGEGFMCNQARTPSDWSILAHKYSHKDYTKSCPSAIDMHFYMQDPFAEISRNKTHEI